MNTDAQTSTEFSLPKRTARRASATEKSRRVNVIFGFLVRGMRRAEIIEFVKSEWRLTAASADYYITQALALIKAEATQAREEYFAEHLAYRRRLRVRAETEGDLRLAWDISRDEANLLGLYPARSAVVRVQQQSAEEMTDSELIAILTREQAREQEGNCSGAAATAAGPSESA